MSPKAQYQQSQRMICVLAGLDHRRVRRSQMTDLDRQAYNLAAQLLGDGTLMCDSSGDVAARTSDRPDGSLEACERAWKQLEERFEAAMLICMTWAMRYQS